MKQLSIYEDLERYNNHSYATDHDSTCGNNALANNSVSTALPATKSTDNNAIAPAKVEANVTEIIIAKDKADNVQMLLPMLTHLNQDKRWLAWIDPPMQLLKQWREKTHGMMNDDIMVVRSDNKTPALELTQKALKAGTCHAVIVWTEKLSNEQFEALESASAVGNSHGIVLRYR
jgi:cell division inhibitor SulA